MMQPKICKNHFSMYRNVFVNPNGSERFLISVQKSRNILARKILEKKKKFCCPHFPGFFYTNGLDIGRNWNVKSKYSARLISTCKTINIVVKKLNFVNLTNFSSKSIFDHACGSKFTIYCCCSSYFLKSGAM